MHPAHPLGVALGQVVVDRDDVHALAGERVEVRGQGADQGLALTGLHLGDVAEVQRRAAHDLDVVVALAEHPLGRLADGGERLGQQVVEGLAVGVALLVLVGERAQLGVGEVDEVLFDGVDLVRDAVQLAQDLAFACTHELVEDGHVGWLLAGRAWHGRVRWRGIIKGHGPRRNGHRKRGPRCAGRSVTSRARYHLSVSTHRTPRGCPRSAVEILVHRRGSPLRLPLMEPVTLTTERLVLRPFEPADADAVHAACQDPEIPRWTDVPVPVRARARRGLHPAGLPERLAGRHRVQLRRGHQACRRARRLYEPATPGAAGCPAAPGGAGLLDGEGAPAAGLHRRGGARRGRVGVHPARAWNGWSGAPRSATRAHARWPALPGSGWRGPIGPGSCTRELAGTAGAAPLLPSDWGLPSSTPYLPSRDEAEGVR